MFTEHPHVDDGTPEELLTRAVGGDHDAFTLLYRRHLALVRAAAHSVLGDRAQAEEVAHDVFLELLCTTSTYSPALGSARSWLVMLTRRRAIDRVRSAQSARVRDAVAAARETALTAPDPSEQVESRMAAERLRAVLARLRREQAEVLLLTYFGNMSQRDVATYLRVPVGTVKSRMHVALATLRHLLPDG